MRFLPHLITCSQPIREQLQFTGFEEKQNQIFFQHTERTPVLKIINKKIMEEMSPLVLTG